jgi:hypothetical protein
MQHNEGYTSCYTSKQGEQEKKEKTGDMAAEAEKPPLDFFGGYFSFCFLRFYLFALISYYIIHYRQPKGRARMRC